MLKKLKDILNTYTDEELEDMDLWINSDVEIGNIIIDENSIDLITTDGEIEVNSNITKEAK